MAHPDLNELRRVARGGTSSRRPPSRPEPPLKGPSNNWLGPLLGWGVGIWLVVSGVNCWMNAPQRTTQSAPMPAVIPIQPTESLVMKPPAKKTVQVKISGTWRGTFDGDRAELHIYNRSNNRFEGTLTIHASKGFYRVALRGVLAENGRVAMQETKVLRTPRGAQWTRGINVGGFSNSNLVLSGRGKAPTQNAYSWTFNRVS